MKKVFVVGTGKMEYGVEWEISDETLGSRPMPYKGNAADIMLALSNKVAFIIGVRHLSGEDKHWKAADLVTPVGRGVGKFNNARNQDRYITLTVSERTTWTNGIKTWLEYANGPLTATMSELADVSVDPSLSVYIDKKGEHHPTVARVGKRGTVYYFAQSHQCGGLVGEGKRCPNRVHGFRKLSVVDGKFSREQDFKINEGQGTNQGTHYYCPEHPVVVMSPEDFFLGKSAAAPADAPESEYAQLSKARLNKLHMQGLVQKIKDYKEAEDGFCQEIKELEETIEKRNLEILKLKEEMSSIMTADDLLTAQKEELAAWVENQTGWSDAQVGLFHRIIVAAEKFIAKGGK